MIKNTFSSVAEKGSLVSKAPEAPKKWDGLNWGTWQMA
jgi:hypothetical protein